jgi:hypothetical protein
MIRDFRQQIIHRAFEPDRHRKQTTGTRVRHGGSLVEIWAVVFALDIAASTPAPAAARNGSDAAPSPLAVR